MQIQVIYVKRKGMSRWNKKKKKWLDCHAKYGNRKRIRKHGYQAKTQGLNYAGPSTNRLYSVDNKPVVIQTPPKNFSLLNNPEETMGFFVDFKREIDRNQRNTAFFVDSKNVESVTVDALIYLIAILQNDKLNNNLKYSYSGNFPENEEAKRIYTECGFTDYVDSKMKTLPSSNEKMRIICGNNNDPQSAKELCIFIMDSLNKRKKDIYPLQKVLVELMSNVYYHAYEKHSFMAKKWYMYAEHIEDYVRCVFVDTGFGIAYTARKNIGENLKMIFGMKIDDAKIIQSIFDSDITTSRTATNENYRGNGLVSVRENIRKDLFEGLQVLSGRGRCIMPKDSDSNEIITYCYQNKLYGTLYEFIIR